jgi:hypothetical protein
VLCATTPRIRVYDVTRPSNNIAGGSRERPNDLQFCWSGPKALTKNIALGILGSRLFETLLGSTGRRALIRQVV